MRGIIFSFFLLLIINLNLSAQQEGDCPYPILFVHGINSDNTTWDVITGQLQGLYGSPEALSFNLNSDPNSTFYINDVSWVSNPASISNKCVYTLNFKNQSGTTTQSASNESAIVKQGYAVKLAIDAILQATAKQKVIVVAHSMGGLATREYLQRFSNSNNHHVAKLLTLGTPHLGSNAAIFGLAPFGGVSIKSEAGRDLAHSVYQIVNGSYVTVPGYYLFGGMESVSQYPQDNENSLVTFHDLDVDADGDTNDAIVGLNLYTTYNPSIPLPQDIKYTYYVSNFNHAICIPLTGGFGCGGDILVDDMRMWLYQGGDGSTYDYVNDKSIPEPNDGVAHRSSDRITSKESRRHDQQTSDFVNIIRGLDEGDFPFYAHEIVSDNNYNCFSNYRADKVALNSNPLVPSAESLSDPYIDADWYKVKINDTKNYRLTINKPLGQYFRVDFFTNSTPSSYDNITNGDIVKVSQASEANQIVLDLGVLESGITYFVRVTSEIDKKVEENAVYSINIHDLTTIVLSNNQAHKPFFYKGIIDIAQLKLFPSKRPPIYNSSDGSWTLFLKYYNGYFIDVNLHKTSYPQCGTLEQIGIIPKSDAGIINSGQALLNLGGINNSYDGELSLRCKFSENTGLKVDFPEGPGLLAKVIFYPLIEPLLEKVVSKITLNPKIRQAIHNHFLDKLGGSITSSDISNLASFKSARQAANEITKFLTQGAGAIIITQKISSSLSSAMQEAINKYPNELKGYTAQSVANELVDLLFAVYLNDAVDLVKIGGKKLSLSIQMTSALATIAGGIADIASTKNLEFCMPIEFEDNAPYQYLANTPVNNSSINTSNVNLNWKFADIDGDPLVYDLFIKAPNSNDFIKVAENLNTETYQYTLNTSGLYQWKVIAKYPWQSTLRVSSETSTFVYNCVLDNPITITSQDLQMIRTDDAEYYNLIFGFSGNFSNNKSYSATFSYDTPSGVINEIKPVTQNVSDPQNMLINLKKDYDIQILVQEGCNNTNFKFKPYPKFDQLVNLSNCSTKLKVKEMGSYPSYTVQVNNQNYTITNVNQEIPLGDNIFGSEGFIVNVIPQNVLDTQFLNFYLTCIGPDLVCNTINLDSIDFSCENRTFELKTGEGINMRLTTLSAEEYILNNGESNLIPVEAFGSPKFGVVMFDNAVPGCTTALVLPIPCLLGSIYLTNEGLALRNLLNDAQLCGWRIPESNFRLPSMQSILSQNANQSLPSVISGSLNSLYYIKNYKESQISKRLEIFGNLVTNQSFIEFEAIFERFIENESLISITDSLQILNELIQFDIEPRYVISMISRWNNSIRAWNLGILEPNNEYPNIIIKSNLQYHNDIIKAVVDYSTSRGFSSVDSLYNFELTQINNYSLENDPTINPVCASVGISLSQKLTMTREAFEGTLKVFNGNPTTQMDSIKLNLVILNEDGVISNDLFEIETTSLEFLSAIDGTGTLAGDKEGIAKILFIPEIGAAPTIPKFYSFGGSISYIDPFGGLKVTMPLVPVTLQVNPSPNLKLHYFLQRDIISDDPLTTKIEPTLPASLAVMIENNGYGVAANLRIQSAQPQVIDNEKGLALNMNFIGSKLQGQAATMGLTNINFGNINPLSTKIGEWIFTSNVLGHFIGYATSVRHLSSRGNPNLSLVEGAELHEWIKSVQVYGSQSDGINDFLVNEIPDAEDRPDAIYLSQGNIVNTVEYAQTGSFLNPILFPTFTNTLSVDPTATGWNYIKLNDPGNGEYDLVSVTRNVDNQSIPLDNAWLTFVTIPDTKVPKYEYKFHFVDNFADSLPKSYTVVWSPKDPTPPFVDTIVGAPVQVTASKVNTLKVIFSEPIDESTFTIADITLINQGGPNLIDSNVPITKLDSITYLIDISSKTNMNGYFVFTVQTTGITDVTGTNGFYAKQVSWTQYLTVPVVQEFIDFPVSGITSAYDTVRIKFNLAIDTSSLRANDFIVKKDGVSIPGSIDVSLVFSDFRTFELRGIHNLLTTDGLYTLGIILPSIKSTTNIFGLDTQYFSFVLDTKGPDIVSITKLNTGSLDAQHVTGVQISFDEIIMSFDTTSLFLYKDNIQAQISPITLQKLTGSKYNVLWKADASYGNGIYKFLIDETKFKDVTNIFGSGKDSITWVTSRSSGLIISNLYIDPDYGYSSMDGVTYQRNGTFYCTLSETGTDLRLYQQDNSGALILLNSLPMSQVGQSAALPYTVSSTGNTTLVIKVKDQYGNEVSKSKVITIDDVALNGVWSLPQNLNFVSQPDSLNYFFGNKLLNTNLTSPNIIRIYKDNIEISNPGFIISVLNDSTFRVKGIPMIGNTPGQYKLSWNKSFYQKYISGKPGEGTSDLIWRIVNSNGAPIANAGADIILKDLGLVGLNGSGSYDPDSDPLSYKWISLDQVTLSDSTAVSPNFVATEKHVGKVLTFLLLVSDGSKTSSDLVRVFIELDDILLNTKIFLQGPYSDSDGLMSDQLRVQNLIPLAHPYTDISRYKFGNKSKNVIPAIFQVQGNDAIVDWVYIEIKDVDKDSILNGGAFLLQRDGDIVDSNGVSSAVFLNIPKGKYSISVFHRNHVPIRTSSFINIILNKIENVDLTQDPLKILGDINAVNSISGIYVMMSGDADRNGQVQQIDVHQCFGKLNEMGYLTEDLDMNGTVERIDIDMKLLPNLGRGKQF